MKDLNEIMSERPADPQDVEVHDQQEQQTEPHEGRDELGRFASSKPDDVQPEVPETVQPESNKPPEGFIPIQALDERMAKANERFAALEAHNQMLERQLLARAQPQPAASPATPAKPFLDLLHEDPEAALDARFGERVKNAVDPVMQQFNAFREQTSEIIARLQSGDDEVNAAMAAMERAAGTNPQSVAEEYARMMRSPHPYGELVKWHKTQTTLSTYGSDPEAWRNSERERIRAELLAEMGGGQPPAPTASQQPRLPTSFAGARSAGTRSVPVSGARPLSDIMGR